MGCGILIETLFIYVLDEDGLKTPIVYSEKCLGYGNWHIEGPQRIRKAQEVLQEKGYKFSGAQAGVRGRFVWCP